MTRHSATRTPHEIVHYSISRPNSDAESVIRRECGSNIELLRQCLSILKNTDQTQTADQHPSDLNNPIEKADTSPTRIEHKLDRYHIEGLIGKGGMANVYRAKRKDGIHDNDVAIKIIRETPDNKELIHRFYTERKILAELNHPNIARMYDGGETASGLPYFVMELVNGLPIDQFNLKNMPSVRDQVQLFIKICQAVAYAHQNLVIHRDLKPSNVLVDDADEPKLLDFGVAKIFSLDSQENTPITTNIMTPSYASPEQLRRGSLTTASDLYSLGVMLYELLTGTRPYQFSTDITPGSKTTEIFDGIEKPSGRLKRIADLTSTTLANELTDSRRRANKIKGDLDSICLKLLRREPDQRYTSAQALIDDLQQYLDGKPVQAAKGSQYYYFSRFAKRHYKSIAATILGLTFTVVSITIQQLRLVTERDIAIQEKELANEARKQAELEKNKYKETKEFLIKLFDKARPDATNSEGLSVSEILDLGVAEINDKFPNQPELKAEIIYNFADIYRTLGKYTVSKALAEESLSIRTSIYPSGHPDLGKSFNQLGAIHYRLGEFEAAIPHIKNAINIHSISEHPQKDQFLADAYNNLAIISLKLGNSKDAIDGFKKYIHLQSLSRDYKKIGIGHLNLAIGYQNESQYDLSVTHYKKSIEYFEKTDPISKLKIAHAYSNMVGAYTYLKEFESAEQAALLSLEIRKAHYDDNHPLIAHSYYSLGYSLLEQEKVNEAAQALMKSIAIMDSSLSTTHPSRIAPMSTLGSALTKQGKLVEAKDILTRAMKICDENYKSEHPNRGNVFRHLGNLSEANSDLIAAKQFYQQAFSEYLATRGAEHPQTIEAKKLSESI